MNNTPNPKAETSGTGRADPGGSRSFDRRDFLKYMGLGATAAFITSPWRVAAGPFRADDFEKLVPADKKLHPAWVSALFERGSRTVYRGAELEKIGTPIGGICAGQLYLGGDGKLWQWAIFNHHEDTGSSGPHYAHPPKPASPAEQGFALRVTSGGKSQVRALDRSGWSDISFIGEYPLGFVEYRDAASPVSASLEAFSPFIPLDTEDSALPVTVMRFTLTNGGVENAEVELAGWLENAVCLHSAESRAGLRRNRLVQREAFTFLECSADPASEPQRTDDFDFGTMGVALLKSEGRRPKAERNPKSEARRRTSNESEEAGHSEFFHTSLPEPDFKSSLFFDSAAAPAAAGQETKPFGQKLIGSIGRKLSLAPGASATVTFLMVWHFPNLKLDRLGDFGGHWYGKRFSDALAVAEYVSQNFDRLRSQTKLWHETWYDSTLPYWFLDRTFLNTSILATNTCFWLGNGRFYAWEGVGCCAGTCTHVWHYAHAMARLFPSLERSLRELADYGAAFDPATGRIRFRAEHNDHWAVDGQSGVILRTYREHQMSADDGFLRRVWPRAKKALEFLISKDAGADGIIDGPQHNTLDADWFGQIAWLSGLYLAALRAGEEMAKEMGDETFARQCREIFEKGRRAIDDKLFNGQYYLQLPDTAHAKSVGSYDGCEIDQVMGQSWAWQVGLGRILDEAKTKTALRSLWRYNFTPDVGPYRNVYQPGRWYALAGEGGLLMCTWPRGEAQRVKERFDYYFNECMTGFEYQAAGHMLAEGLLQEGLAVTRMVHDRYHPLRRNPWNEVECGDHYARAMASYGVFLAACGYEHHGPKGHLAFAPRLAPEDFRAAFTTAQGWGTFSQKLEERGQRAGAKSPKDPAGRDRNPHSHGGALRAEISLKWGKLRLRALALQMPANAKAISVEVAVNGQAAQLSHRLEDERLMITLAADALIAAGQKIAVVVGYT